MATGTSMITAQTATDTSSNITVAAGSSVQVYTIQGLGHREWIKLERYDGSSYGESEDLLDEKHHQALITGPITFRVRKSVTSEQVAVVYDS